MGDFNFNFHPDLVLGAPFRDIADIGDTGAERVPADQRPAMGGASDLTGREAYTECMFGHRAAGCLARISHRLPRLLHGLAILILSAGTGGALAQLLGPEFPVNTYTTGSQASPQVAANGTGKFVVVWESDGQDGDGSGIFGQRFDADQLPVGGEFQVNQYTTGLEFGPRVAVDGDGRFVVTWSNAVSRSRIVSARRYDAAGLPLGNEFQVNSNTEPRVAWARDVTADVEGNFVVLWSYASLGPLFENGGFGQRFDATGQPVGTEFPVGARTMVWPGGGDSLATTGPGEFVVSLRSCYGGYPYLCSPAAQRFDGAGEVGNEIQVHNYTTIEESQEVRVASAGGGDFVVAWEAHSYYAAGPGDVFARRIDANGAPLGATFPVSTHTPSEQSNPAVAVDGNGNFVVVWESLGRDGSGHGIFGRRFVADGSAIGSEFQINGYTTGEQRFPSVTAGSVGDFVVVWQSDGQDGSGAGVVARRIWSSVFWGDFELGDPCDWSTVVGSSCQ